MIYIIYALNKNTNELKLNTGFQFVNGNNENEKSQFLREEIGFISQLKKDVVVSLVI